MGLTLKPFGFLRIYPGQGMTSQAPGPLAFRSASRLDSATWENETFGVVKFLFGMGSYLEGATGAAQVNIRAALQAEDGVRFYLEYIARGDMPSHSVGETPVIMAGQIDIDPTNAKYAWLNSTQVVARGMLTLDPICQNYEMYVMV